MRLLLFYRGRLQCANSQSAVWQLRSSSSFPPRSSKQATEIQPSPRRTKLITQSSPWLPATCRSCRSMNHSSRCLPAPPQDDSLKLRPSRQSAIGRSASDFYRKTADGCPTCPTTFASIWTGPPLATQPGIRFGTQSRSPILSYTLGGVCLGLALLALHNSAPSLAVDASEPARALGIAPMRRGEPGYHRGLDTDNHGIACEPYMAGGH